jgi:hypothetical protein
LSRRRLRLRRRLKGELPRPKLLEVSRSRAADVAKDSDSSGREIAEELVFRTGCCLLEAALTAVALFALLGVPMYLLLNRVT